MGPPHTFTKQPCKRSDESQLVREKTSFHEWIHAQNVSLPSFGTGSQQGFTSQFSNDTLQYHQEPFTSLDYLKSVDQLIINQQIEGLEAVSGFDTNNRYCIKNSLGQQIFYVAEDNDCCTRNCCGAGRPFNMNVIDVCGRQILRFDRPFRQSCCCFPCCLQELQVFSTFQRQALLGSVEENWSLCIPKFSIKNAKGEAVILIEGPFSTASCCGSDVMFKLFDMNGNHVGNISKQWSGFLQETYTKADNFGITFPMDLEVSIKSVLIGACILIDMMFYENTSSNC